MHPERLTLLQQLQQEKYYADQAEQHRLSEQARTRWAEMQARAMANPMPGYGVPTNVPMNQFAQATGYVSRDDIVQITALVTRHQEETAARMAILVKELETQREEIRAIYAHIIEATSTPLDEVVSSDEAIPGNLETGG